MMDKRFWNAFHIFIGVFGAAVLLAGGIALVGKLGTDDSGVAMCRAMADNSRTVAANGDTPMTADEYRAIRKRFDGSTSASIRQAGTEFIDVTYQVARMKDDDGVLLYAGAIADRYARLVSACQDSGVTLPTLAELSDIRESASPVTTR